MSQQILNRHPSQGFQALPDLADLKPLDRVWLPIEVTGKHDSLMGSEEIVEVIDKAAIDSMVREFWLDEADPDFPGLLVDNDHLKFDQTQSTEAKAWVKRLENRGGTLHGLLEVTDVGADAIRNKRWKFFSTEYAPPHIEIIGRDERGRPMVRPKRLDGLTLTNMPNHKGQKPITNRKAPEAEQTQTTKPMNKTALEKLGLDETATEEQVNARLDELIARAAKADEMEAGVEAEAILNRHAKRFPADDRGKWKDRLIKNREATEEILGDLPEIAEKKPEGRAPIFNRSTAKQPEGATLTQGDDTAAADEVKAARISNRARELHGKGSSMTSAYVEAAKQIESEDKAKG